MKVSMTICWILIIINFAAILFLFTTHADIKTVYFVMSSTLTALSFPFVCIIILCIKNLCISALEKSRDKKIAEIKERKILEEEAEEIEEIRVNND